MNADDAAPAVTLEQVLARREARVRQRQRLLERHAAVLVQLTLVTPGPAKDTPRARRVFDAALAALRGALAAAGADVTIEMSGHHPTGPEALLAVEGGGGAAAVKRALVALEDGHPLGRLIDADVFSADGAGVPRRQLGLPPRRCLVCDQPAHACARSRAHTAAQLERALAEIVDAAGC